MRADAEAFPPDDSDLMAAAKTVWPTARNRLDSSDPNISWSFTSFFGTSTTSSNVLLMPAASSMATTVIRIFITSPLVE